jgi:hypothetical protein
VADGVVDGVRADEKTEVVEDLESAAPASDEEEFAAGQPAPDSRLTPDAPPEP